MGVDKVRLCERDVMLERLKQVSNRGHLVNKFYPLLLEGAGQELLPSGVITVFELALEQYAGDAAMLKAALRMDIEKYIDAMVPDAEQAELVKHLQRMREEARQAIQA